MAKIKKISINGVVYDVTDANAQTQISNLPTPPTKLSELTQDENYRTVTDEEKTKWNNNSSSSGTPTTDTEVATIDEVKTYLST